MITKTDCILLLADMKNKGIDTTSALNEVVSSNSISLSVLKFINDNRGLELSAFYENLRKNYNNKKSKLSSCFINSAKKYTAYNDNKHFLKNNVFKTKVKMTE